MVAAMTVTPPPLSGRLPVGPVGPVYAEVGEIGTTDAGGVTRPAWREVRVWCPGCNIAHPFTVEVMPGYQGGAGKPVWTWDGNLITPTFSPSLLVHGSVHLCPPEYPHVEECPDHDTCPLPSHGYAWRFPDGRLRTFKVHEVKPAEAVEVYTHGLPHAVEPAWGNCHSFLTGGLWQFLDDCAHALAGQTVPMVPLPDWYRSDLHVG